MTSAQIYFSRSQDFQDIGFLQGKEGIKHKRRFPIDSLSENEYYAQISGNRKDKPQACVPFTTVLVYSSRSLPRPFALAASFKALRRSRLVVPLLLAVLVEPLVEVLKQDN